MTSTQISSYSGWAQADRAATIRQPASSEPIVIRSCFNRFTRVSITIYSRFARVSFDRAVPDHFTRYNGRQVKIGHGQEQPSGDHPRDNPMIPKAFASG